MGWNKLIEDTVIPKMVEAVPQEAAPETTIVEIPAEVPPPPLIPKKRCFYGELENFWSIGTYGGKGYRSVGGRAIIYPCSYPYFGITAKAMFSEMPPYQTDQKSDGKFGISFADRKENLDFKIGIRLQSDKQKPVAVLYAGMGWQRYDFQWRDQLTWETEIQLNIWRLKAESILSNQPSVNYLWARHRIKMPVWNWQAGEFRVGAEHYYEGNDYLNRPSYYYTRGGGLIEYFRPFGVNNWWSSVAHTGHGTFGWYLGLEFNIGTGLIPQN